jgi:hypothetical protein
VVRKTTQVLAAAPPKPSLLCQHIKQKKQKNSKKVKNNKQKNKKIIDHC